MNLDLGFDEYGRPVLISWTRGDGGRAIMLYTYTANTWFAIEKYIAEHVPCEPQQAVYLEIV
jgi:hypothetical protein